ncbi:MAG: S8 family peptidase [Pirellulaceae bacterium]
MNSDFPPKQLAPPRIEKRRPDPPRRQPLPPELLAQRQIARILGLKVDSLNKLYQKLTNDQRKAIFFKITHDGTITKNTFDGTGLRPLVDRSHGVTLVVPRDENLDKLDDKIKRFATDEPSDGGFLSGQDFARFEDIELGKPKDRLSDELFAAYDSLVASQFVICEIEMISLHRGRNQQRLELESIRQDLHSAFASGVHGTLFEHQEHGDGCCRAVIRCTGAMFKRLVEEAFWQRRIAWFEPKPRFETFHSVWHNFQFDKLAPISSPPEDAPVVCVIDSGVSPGNPFVQPVTKEDLSKSFLKTAPDDPFDEVGHGSGVASLVAYYALTLEDGADNTPKCWIANARILGPDNQIEDERLFGKALEEIVEHFAPLGVRIFNLSVADLAKKWNQDTKRTQPRSSWTARVIDQLSQKHDVVFVVATGNLLLTDIQEAFKSGGTYPHYLLTDESRILDPGQAALALSVGSISSGTLVAHAPDTAIALDFEPSPFTRCGPGIKGETKPEIVDVGGNLIRTPDGSMVRANSGTNVVMASHQLTPAAVHKFGTSFAAPRVSHKLAVILHELNQLGIGHVSAPLLKAFLVNSVSYRGDLAGLIERGDPNSVKWWLHLLGYGFPDSSLATECDDYSMLLFHQGELPPNQVAFFDIPIPVSLAGTTSTKRVTVTVVHHPEVQKWGLESYFGSDLKWRMFRGDIDQTTVVEAMSRSEDVETDAELPNEVQFDHKITRRSRGSVQHDICEWTMHKESYSQNHYTLAIASHQRWDRDIGPTPFAMVVQIEDTGAQVPIYAEIATRLEQPIEQRI